MNTDDVEKLADACGEIARGFKKIRSVLLRTGTVEELPPPVPTVPTELVRTFVLQYEHEVDCVCDPKFIWGAGYETSLYRIQLQNKIRADRYGNQWVMEGGRWRSVSRRYIDILHNELESCHSEVRQLLQNSSNGEFTNTTGEHKMIKPSKWARRLDVINTELNPKHFRTFLVETHKELGPLRSRRT